MMILRTLSSSRFATQLLTLLVTALVVAFAISMVVTLIAQRLNDHSVRDRFAAERVYELTTAIEALAIHDRKIFTELARTKTTSITVKSESAVFFTAENQRSQNLANEISAALGRADVRATVLSRSGFLVSGDARESGRNREVIAVSVPLTSDEWLNFNSREPRSWYTKKEQQFMFFVFAVSMLSVSCFAWFFVRRITQPVEALALAARKSANGDRSVRIPITGPSEFREAAIAFNRMQTQIGRFETERARTIAAVGHDLRTPLTSLRIRTEMVENQQLRDPMIKTLDEVAIMANGLISYAHHRQEEKFEARVDLNAIVENLAAENSILFESPLFPMVTGAPVSLSRAIRNLIENAIRYSNLVSISLDVEGNSAVVCINDHGPGIKEDLLATIRNPFVRGENSRNSASGGYGLGLTIADEIISSHGGELALINTEKGLCATITLPLCYVTPE